MLDAQAMDGNELVGVVISKLEVHRGGPLRGYIAMLAVKMQHRGKGIGGARTFFLFKSMQGDKN